MNARADAIQTIAPDCTHVNNGVAHVAGSRERAASGLGRVAVG